MSSLNRTFASSLGEHYWRHTSLENTCQPRAMELASLLRCSRAYDNEALCLKTEKNMTTVALRKRVGNRWNTLRYLDRDSKIDLITMLTQSLRTTDEPSTVSASKYYGIWGDDGMSSEEFVDALKSERKFKQDIVEL